MTTSRSENYRFEDEFLKKVCKSNVWKKLSFSEELNWSESLIDKYADSWSWEVLCSNSNIPWNENMIEKYKHRIQWKHFTASIFNCFSHRRGLNAIDVKSTEEVLLLLHKFSDYWDWELISSRGDLNFTPELIETFAHKWDWKELIDNNAVKWNYPLYERFSAYIPLLDIVNLKRSVLWEALVEMDYKIITRKILSEQ
jgi:hypothetical protein